MDITMNKLIALPIAVIAALALSACGTSEGSEPTSVPASPPATSQPVETAPAPAPASVQADPKACAFGEHPQDVCEAAGYEWKAALNDPPVNSEVPYISDPISECEAVNPDQTSVEFAECMAGTSGYLGYEDYGLTGEEVMPNGQTVAELQAEMDCISSGRGTVNAHGEVSGC